MSKKSLEDWLEERPFDGSHLWMRMEKLVIKIVPGKLNPICILDGRKVTVRIAIEAAREMLWEVP